MISPLVMRCLYAHRQLLAVDLSQLHLENAHSQRVTGIPIPGNSRENQPNFFPLDLEKSFSISRSRLETRD